jgi:hypothetical protein
VRKALEDAGVEFIAENGGGLSGRVAKPHRASGSAQSSEITTKSRPCFWLLSMSP